MSGNGYHLHYRLPDLPKEDAVLGRTGLVATALVARHNETPPTHVDQAVLNAARICKLYGTKAHCPESKEREQAEACINETMVWTMEAFLIEVERGQGGGRYGE